MGTRTQTTQREISVKKIIKGVDENNNEVIDYEITTIPTITTIEVDEPQIITKTFADLTDEKDFLLLEKASEITRITAEYDEKIAIKQTEIDKATTTTNVEDRSIPTT